ncbi:MAG: hypothetical protein QW767_00685 [Thermoprotei archaeon]
MVFMDATTILSFTFAATLISGIARKPTYLFGAAFSLLNWSVTGFGGPYQPYTPDIGAPPIYAIVFILLFSYERERNSSWDPKSSETGLLQNLPTRVTVSPVADSKACDDLGCANFSPENFKAEIDDCECPGTFR